VSRDLRPDGRLRPAGDAYRVVVWAVAATALAARIGTAIATDGLRNPQLSEYDAIAHRMLAGFGFSYKHLDVVYYSFIAPLPAWISAASYWLTGSLVAAMVLQIIAGATLAVVTSEIARRLFGGWIAPLAAGLLVALHPGLTLYSAAKLHSLAFDSLFFTLAVLQLFRLAERPTIGRALALGALVGIGAYARATIVIILPIGAVWLFIASPVTSRRKAVGSAMLAMLCAAAVIAPWSIRNSLLHHRFVFMLTTDSEVFWRGNNPYATGSSYIDAEHLVLDALPQDEVRDLHRQPNELAQAEWFRARAMNFVRTHPDAFVRLTVRKFFYFWWFSPQIGVNYPRHWAQLYMGYYVFVLCLAAIGLWKTVQAGGRRMAMLALMGAFLLAISALQSLYYVEGRHRWAVEPMLLALAAGGAAAMVDRRSGSRARMPFV
jgi:4-amino-4-deoxy-L-arabinose transferase-like glycosyltransferase